MPRQNLSWLMSQFHQDWAMLNPTWEDVVARWVSDAGPARTADAAAQLAGLLDRLKTESELSQALDVLGCDYYAADEPDGYRGWLTDVLHLLRAPSSRDAT